MKQTIGQWQMTQKDKPFKYIESIIPGIESDEALVKVAGCGVCHTDISFWHHGVTTRKELPLTLGHEISGTVIKGPKHLLNKAVIIPAVLPCGECSLCKSDRSNICRNQKMPGNDFNGGFATHVTVPSRFLIEVPEKALQKYKLEELAVIADAISTPYQVMVKSGLNAGELAIIIGVGGVGIYGTLLAKLRNAKVIAIDISDHKLDIAKQNGADLCINSTGKNVKEIKTEVKEFVKKNSLSPFSWKIFEMSGTAPGQDLAFALLTYASSLSIVGFTMEKTNVRLSNLMAFDATIIGTWGCKPELYYDVLELIAEGKLNIAPFVETLPLSSINEVFSNTLQHKYDKRCVLVPDK